VIAILTRGGIYADDGPQAAADFQISYLTFARSWS
jgi:hypothetical protein